MLAYFLDMLGHPFPSLIQSLRLIQYHRFFIGALIIIPIQLIDILIGEDLIVECDGILIGTISFDDFVE
jgi:hypothetical protein